jgi:CheY-like chemotaxis protein
MSAVLIVEDTVLNIDLISQLAEDDCELLFARDGREGVVQARDLGLAHGRFVAT